METLKVSGTVRSAAFVDLLNLEKFEMYFVLRLLQRLFFIIHLICVKCQSCHATTDELTLRRARWVSQTQSIFLHKKIYLKFRINSEHSVADSFKLYFNFDQKQ